MKVLSCSELDTSTIENIARYWSEASDEHLVMMGVDLTKRPTYEGVVAMLEKQIALSYADKKALATIWFVNRIPIGHCNVNSVVFGEEAFMHLHIWKPTERQKGIGAELVKLSLSYFFENLKLQRLYCEPASKNRGPNSVLKKVGFTELKTYWTQPNAISIEQNVTRWVLTKEQFDKF